ncbi:hypothetical protein DICPUDRAFT_79181 [Dictyostelium purpureum]|uniref:Elongator complex protein 1 n=1 Tax=Dictyostelium purpureum TaxID=5786 RepID=F0ZLT5_DICPU|nr:uncharacterized protein DICPUDRAFT_79181 [Dictyostelium purpureum]EGC35070.1 hypothetical protein DICPUDRAFT_79181 [Dictyostelium purpureum]|eukprot:XP_003288377.1 hypothetical protein DICPUDRAFT_79181 [Dictyostelium purpureum]
MKNITRLIEFSDLIEGENGFKLFSFDNQNNIVYFITSSNQLIIYSPSNKKVTMKIELNDQDILSEGALINSIQFIPDLEAICMATDKGDILMYSTSNGQLECVGIVGSGITCMSWSPDYELFILATESETLIQMTKDWEILNEVSINSYLPGKEASQYNTSNSNNNITLDNKTKIPIISWRGDGQYFSCTSFDSATNSIQLRVWERSLQLHSMNETSVAGLENQISWRPSGSLIAVSHRLEQNKRHDISFFERNGLKHGEFTIRSKGTVEAIEWSCDSEILALLLKVVGDDGSEKTVVQLWHRSNYYWFLKQEINCDSSESIVHMKWDLSAPILRIITSQGRYNEYRLCWDYDVSQGFSSENPSIVVMVDGNTLKMTPFRRLVTPPPMSAYSIALPANSNCSGFSFNRNTFQLSVLVNQINSICIYTPASLPAIPVATKQPTVDLTPQLKPTNYSVPPTLTATISIDSSKLQLYKLRHFFWLNETTFVAVESNTNQNDSIVEVIINKSSFAVEHIYRVNTPNKVLRLTNHLESLDQALFETVDGYLYVYNSSTCPSSSGSMESPTSISPFISQQQENIFKFPTPCPWFSSCTINQEDSVVGLNDRNKLYINQNLLCTDCNSYSLHNKFLLFTTVSHVLRSVSLLAPAPTSPLVYIPPAQQNTYANGKSQAIQQTSNYDDSIRDVERGARIVAVVPHDTRLVLQMPRGNLEAISPRSLTLSTIRELLNQHEYLKAFMLMRRNRIDMNLIYDHNPTDFLRHVETFIDQIQNIDYLNLFISSLRDEDTTKTLFVDLETKHLIPPTNVKPSAVVEGKVNLVCDKLRQVLVEKDSIKFNLPILTTYVKKSPPELDQVLRLIQSLRGEEVNENGETIVNRLAEESLDYIVFLVDVNKLYDIALGTYDFELVIMVAQKSQKDPKEYISFLQELQKMERFYQRYSIDKYLNRWETALYNLARAGEQYEQDCLELIKQHNIYKESLVIYGGSEKAEIKNQKEMFKKVSDIYADYLVQHNNYEDAAYLYTSAGESKKALSAFKDACLWENSIYQAKKLNFTNDELNNLAQECSEVLKRNGKFKEAGLLLSQYSDLETSISAYCEGFYYNDAILLAQNKDRSELVDTLINKSILETVATQTTDINSNYEKYQKMATRIVIVRTNKLNYVPLLLPRGGLDPETSSMMSGMSGIFSEGGQSVNSAMSSVTTSSYVSTYSQQTGTFSTATKTRLKKKDKKPKPQKVRLTGKEGSPFEEEYLVEEMKKLIPSIAQQENIGRIVKGLVILNLFDEARQLSTLYQKYLDLIDGSLDNLSASATAILPENKKEKEKEYQLQLQQMEEEQLQQQQQQQPGLPAQPINNNNKFVTLNIKQIKVTRDKSNWNLNIF